MKAPRLLAFLATTLIGGTSLHAQQAEPRLTQQFEKAQFMRLTSASSSAQSKQVMLEAKLKASDASNGALFANGVAISGDTAVIGASWNHIGARRGSAAKSLEAVHSATSSLSSSTRTRRIALIRNARKNGYTTRREGNAIYFQAEGVEDPITKKLLEGVKVLEYRCQANQDRTRMNLQMETGRSERARLACTVMEIVAPQILVLDEAAPGSN